MLPWRDWELLGRDRHFIWDFAQLKGYRRNARFRLPTICSTLRCYFEAIPSYQAKIDISCEILLTESLSSRNARFRLPTICSSLKWYFLAVPSYQAEIEISCEIFLNESLLSRNTRIRVPTMCTWRKCLFSSDSKLSRRDRHLMWDFAQWVAFDPKLAFSTACDL